MPACSRGVTGVYPGGLPYRHPAAREGGPRNGVLTAIEDVVHGRDELRLAVVPAFYGLGVVWDTRLPWSSALADLLAIRWQPPARRLEANRVLHVAGHQYQAAMVNRFASASHDRRRCSTSSSSRRRSPLASGCPSYARAARRPTEGTRSEAFSATRFRRRTNEFSERGDGPAQSVLAQLRARHPRFHEALAADARVTALHRGERHEFRSRLDLAVQVLRLALVSDAFLAQIAYRAKARMQALGIPLLPRLAHRLAMALAQVSIGDPVVVQPGVYVVHGQVVADGLVEIHSGVTIAPFVTIGLRAGDVEAQRSSARSGSDGDR